MSSDWISSFFLSVRLLVFAECLNWNNTEKSL